MDDGIRAFVKVLRNPEGPSALTCEFLGTALAHAVGIPAFEVAVSHFPEELCVPLGHELRPEPGPCRTVLRNQSGYRYLIDDIVNRTPRPWLPAGQVRQDLADDSIALFLRLVSDPELRRREGRARKPDHEVRLVDAQQLAAFILEIERAAH